MPRTTPPASSILTRAFGLAPLLGFATMLGSAACATTPSTEELALMNEASPAKRTEEKLRAALNGKHRTHKEKMRGRYRNPLITLTFMGLVDTMNVVEIWPGYGWYTDILAPVLQEKGKLTVTSADPGGDPNDSQTKQAVDLATRKEKYPEAYGKVETAVIAAPNKLTFGAPNSADMVLTFRNLHGWMEGGYADKVFAEVYKVLKPGGVFGIEDHRADKGKTDPKTGYISEEDAIKVIEASGLKLVEKTELNANPKDTKDYPNGVWSLPPTLAGGAVDRDKYVAIGESDRFTMKFQKPVK